MTGNNLESTFRTGLLFIVMFLMLIATLYFFFSVQDVIDTWFEHEYSPIFSAIFSFIVIVVCIYLTRFFIISRR
ncbi:MAG: hypothetical protein K8R25_17490 [Methanosarcinales archaeon]|nr:hypothetical protein [Methanosarcinales archaeon]